MAELARYLLSEGPDAQPTTAVDAVGGGSGNHNGTYTFGGTRGEMRPGGLTPWFLQLAANATGGYIGSVLNDSDFHLLGEMTVMSWWLKPSAEAFEDTVICSVEGAVDTGNIDNHLFSFRILSTATLRLRWESAHGVFQQPSSPASVVKYSRWNHVAAVRYLVGANLGVKFYVDGVLVGTDDNLGAGYAPPTGGANSRFRINRYGATSPSHNQGVCGVRIYDSAEPIGTIQSVYNSEVTSINGGLSIRSYNDTIIRTQSGILYDPRHMGRRNNRQRAGFNNMGTHDES